MWKLSALVVLALAIVAMTSLICIDSDDSSAVRHATFEVDGIRYSYTQDDLYEPYTTKIGDGANPVIANDVESFTIPSSVEYDGEVYEIEGIGTDAFKNCTNLKSVTIPSSIKVIGKNAFWGCTGLTEFTIPATVREIGSNAFMLCSNLAELTISEGVQTIKQAAFQNCDKLTSITIPSTMSTIGTGAFELCDLLESVVISPGVTKISDSMFSACPALSSVSIPSTVESIGSYAFGSCRALESITIPEGVVTIGSYAFQHCTALKSIVLPSTANSLSYSMLRNCSALETVSVLGNPTLVRELCFAYCTSLRTVNIPDSVETIGNKAFIECSSLQSIVIPEGVTMIGESAFEKCSSMRAAEIPSTIVEFTDRAFYGCSSLQSISIPTGTTTLGDSVFRACTSLTEVTVPGNVTTPGDHLFTGCTSLVSAVLCEGVSCASGSMFEGCTSLRIVTFATTVDTIKGSAFYGCSSLSRRTAGDAQIGEPTTSGTFKIPDSVETIGNKAFYGCSSIKHLTIPRSVTTVSGQTFSNCTSLMEVLVPSTITNMNSFYMFSGCTALEIVEIKEGVSTVGKGMFYGCTSLISVSIREGVETIGERAFYDCISLMDMRIPDSVTTIENKAFENVCMPGGAIPAAGVTVGHQYVCAYDFNNDFSNCDITLTCENDSDHAVSRTVIPVIDNEANEATARLKHGVRIYSKTVPLEIVLPAPTADGRSYVYSGEEQTFVLNGFDSELMTMRDGRQIDAGTYTVTVSIKEGSNAVWSPEVQSDPTYVFTIDKKPITELIISIGELVYTGSSQDAVVTVDGGKAHLNDDFTISGTASAVGAGSYTLTVTAADDGNYIGSDDKTWSIGRKTLTISPVDVNVPIGTAAPEYSADGDGFVEGEGMEDLNGTAAFECGYTSGSIVGATHAISVTGYASDNYTILYDTGTLTVVKARLTAPLATKDVFVFNGEEQTYVPIGFDSNTMVIAGNTRTDAGSQTVTVSIRSPGTYD